MDQNFSAPTILLSGLGILAPIITLYFVVTVLSKNFSQKLISMGQGAKDSEDKKTADKSVSKNKLMTWWEDRITKSGVESVGFNIAWLMTSRSRDYKLKTYPLFGFIPAIFIYIALGGEGSLAERWQILLESDKYLLLIYICIYAAISPIFNLKFSEKYKSSWIFYAMPIDRPGSLLKGAVKSMIAKFVIPIFIISALIVLGIWGFKTIDDILVASINVLLIGLIGGKALLKTMPFSDEWSSQGKGANLKWSFIIMIVLGGIGYLHWLIIDQYVILLVWTIIALGLLWWTLKRFDKMTWKDIR